MSLTSGDINGDSKCDVIIGVPGQQNTLGSVYVIFGSNSFGSSFNVSDLNGSNGFSIDGTTANKNFGISITTGDVNNDGKQDLIVAESDSACVSGNAYVILGKADFSSNNPFDLSTLDGSNGYKV
jgi:FG-GAP-like repeat